MALTNIVFLTFFVLASAKQNSLNDVLFNDDFEYIDLSHKFDSDTVYWPGGKTFSFSDVFAEETSEGWYAANDFAAAEHGGTHMDAPYHFYRKGKFVGEIPLKNLIAPLIVVDVRKAVNDDPNFVLMKSHVNTSFLDHCDKSCAIVFKFGWTKYFGDVNKYLGLSNDNKTLTFPSLSAELVEWIVSSNKNVVGIGVDVASVDPGFSTAFPVHKITASHGLFNMENVNLHRELPEHGCTALMLPMKIAKGTGGPLRFIAICPKELL